MLDRRLRRYVGHGMLTQLAAFEAVVQLGGFTRAAEALHMAQPTVSLLVKRLGETLGVVLFESTSRDIRLTPAGTETYRFCQDFFRSLAGFDDHLMDLRLSTVSPLRIAVCTAAESLAPAMLCGFCERHPELRLMLSVANRLQLLNRLRSEERRVGKEEWMSICIHSIPTNYTSTRRFCIPTRIEKNCLWPTSRENRY